MREIKCKQCGEMVTAKDDKELFKIVKAHFKKEHFLLPATDAMLKDNEKKNAKTVK